MILETQIETGVPYICYKDNANRCSNHKNLGTLTGSNLCTEIFQYMDKDNISVCNVASISLPAYIKIDKNNKA